MTDFKTMLFTLNENLNILHEREAKHAGNAPLELFNQIADHHKALALTKQVINGELSEAEWLEALKPLLIAIDARGSEAIVNRVTNDIQAQNVSAAAILALPPKTYHQFIGRYDILEQIMGDLRDPRRKRIITTLKDSDKDVWQEAAVALGELGDARAVAPLIAALKDRDKYVRRSAAEALG